MCAMCILILRLLSVFNVAHKKIRGLGIIHHVHEVEGGRNLVWHAHILRPGKLHS